MTYPTMWCVQDKKGKLILDTLADTQEDAYFALFDHMPKRFQSKYWKNVEGSTKAYLKKGYVAVLVSIVPTVEFDLIATGSA